MRTRRPTPFRGLVAGLLALSVFGSAAVAMTAHGATLQTTNRTADAGAAVGSAAAFDDDRPAAHVAFDDRGGAEHGRGGR